MAPQEYANRYETEQARKTKQDHRIECAYRAAIAADAALSEALQDFNRPDADRRQTHTAKTRAWAKLAREQRIRANMNA